MVTLLGLIGNIISFIIFSCRRFENTIFSTYFRFVIIADSMSLLTSINKSLEYFTIYLVKESDFCCKFLWYSNYVLFQLSSWTMVFISIDRYLSIAMPNKFPFRKSKNIQMFICLAISIFHMIFYSPILWSFHLLKTISYDNETNLTSKHSECDFDRSVRLDLMDIFDGSVVPFSLMILFTSLMLRTLFNTRKKTRTNHRTNTLSCSNTKSKTSSSKQKDVRFAMISVILNIIFFALTFPFYLFDLLTNFVEIESQFADFIFSILFFFIYINYGLLFYINIFVNKMFSDEFSVVFLGKKVTQSSRTSTFS